MTAFQTCMAPVLVMLAAPREDAAWHLTIVVWLLLFCLPAALVLAIVASWRTVAGVAVTGALLTAGGALGLELGMRLFPRDNLLGGFGLIFLPISGLGVFTLAVGLMAVGLKALAAILPRQWLSFASPTAERLRAAAARFGRGMRLPAFFRTAAIPLLAGYLLVTTAVSFGSLFVADLQETWRAGGAEMWFVAAILATSVIGPLATVQLLRQHPSGRWLASAVTANWGLYNMWRSVQAVSSAAPPDRLIGPLTICALSAFGLVLAAVARPPQRATPSVAQESGRRTTG